MNEDAEDFVCDELLTVQQYADRYGIHVQTVYTAIRKGYRLFGVPIRPSERTIRIAVSRETIFTHTRAKNR